MQQIQRSAEDFNTLTAPDAHLATTMQQIQRSAEDFNASSSTQHSPLSAHAADPEIC